MTQQFPITGMKHKSFDDGVDIAVEYTRNDSNIIIINIIRYYYNFNTMQIDYNCSYVDFVHSLNPKVHMGDKVIDVAPRVRQMMDELENELIGSAIDSNLGLTIPRPNRIRVADAINLDGSINLQAIGNDENQTSTETSIKESTPKRQRTRWELLELD